MTRGTPGLLALVAGRTTVVRNVLASPRRTPGLLALIAGAVVALGQPWTAARPALGQSEVMRQSEVVRSAYHDFRVVTVVEGLVHPWSIAFLPGGDILVTEKHGRLRIVRDGRLLPVPVPGVPDVYKTGQGGLHEVLLHPEFASNRLVYLSYSKPLGDGTQATTAVIRGTFEDDRFTQTDKVFEAAAAGSHYQNFGGKLAFGPEGFLWVTVGDRQATLRWWQRGPQPAQDLRTHHGVVVRLRDDGSVPDDNPFAGKRRARPETWSYGHRNPQGLAFHPETGVPWVTEHGPDGGDEVNRLEAGKNYGWPVIGYGVEDGSSRTIHETTRAEGMEQPLHLWVPSVAPSGLAFYTGDKFPEWRGNLFAGSLVGERLERLTVEDGRVTAAETVLRGVGRIRDVRQGPDGYIYLAITARNRFSEATPIVRMEPAG